MQKSDQEQGVLRKVLAAAIARHTAGDEDRETAIPGLLFFRREAITQPCACMVEPSLVLVAQGAKQMLVGDDAFPYGITLAADLYLPKDRGTKRLPALAVGGPFGAVKEQSSGLYAQTMAERGFATLAFDGSYTGESGGESRNVASPDINTEDFSAAVDFLGLQKEVDRERIGIIGICGWGGMALSATAVDKRVKAVVTSTMYDMTRVMSKGYNDSMTLEQRTQALEQMSRQRWIDAEKGSPAYQSAYNSQPASDAPQFVKDYYDYYGTPRGYHKRAVNSGNAWTQTTPLSFMNMPILSYIKEISPRPILFVHGENAHSRYFSETAYAAAAEPKELLIVKGASHVDLYDNKAGKIPYDAMVAFFGKYLK